MDIYARIKELQEARGWTINHMAYVAGLNSGTVTNWFKRHSTPTIECLEKLCDAFGITLSKFFSIEENKTIELSPIQKECLSEFDILDEKIKDNIIQLMKSINEKTEELPSEK